LVHFFSLFVNKYSRALVDVLLVNLNSLIAKLIPGNEATLLDHFNGLLSLVNVVHQLSEVAQKLSITGVVVEVLLGMETQFTSLVQGRLGLTTVNLDHEINFIELANKELVTDGHSL